MSAGCIAGAEQMPINGDTWQVMRLSRNRNWGHPDMIALLKRLSVKAHKDAGWPGILVGDIGQPRGGPALSGHASHQIGLDADIWLTPMPDHLLVARGARGDVGGHDGASRSARRRSARSSRRAIWMVLRDAAQEPAVQRIFVNAAIKKALCREAKGDRSWLSKIRPWYGHDYHFPYPHGAARPAAANARASRRSPEDEGCKRADLAYWFKDSIIHPEPPKEPPKPSHGITLAQLPAACKRVLAAPDAKP